MTGEIAGGGPKRTAVLVVHGMGLQRPLDTVREIVNAVWLGGAESGADRRIWVHPERSGTDIDLPVITTNAIPGTDGRRADFHELYWSHLMSETRAVAVLFWLFDLVRKGPGLNRGMNEVWWAGAVFMVLAIQSISLLVLLAVARSTHIVDQPASLLIAPVQMFLILGVATTIGFTLQRAMRIAKWSAIFTAALAGVYVTATFTPQTEQFVTSLLPTALALMITIIMMGTRWGLPAFGVAYAMAFGFELLRQVLTGGTEWLPWTLTSEWCAFAAWIIIAIYLIVNAAFLQPYLGDAARYFRNAPSNVAVRREIRRQAVNTLEALHESGKYDRIVIVAHSLGSVIAYDMLRAYFGRIFRHLPADAPELKSLVDEIDAGALNDEALREKGRELIARMAEIVGKRRADGDPEARAWLVTDFITLGSPLTHAHYFMCRGHDEAALAADFKRKVTERELPTCPPRLIDGDGMLTHVHASSGQRRFHYGAMFGLTRWTNLYFPRSQLFWGDAIGGKTNDVFGDAIFDVPVCTNHAGEPDFFTHRDYWDVSGDGGYHGPHIAVLRDAIDLADLGTPNRRRNFPVEDFPIRPAETDES
jgi:hypothetical protein